MQEYTKIDAIFNRDPVSKKTIFNNYRNPEVEFLKDNIWEFTERVDGTNIRIHWDGYQVVFGGRTDNAQIPQPLVDKLNKLFGGDANENLFEQKFENNEVILFGEGYGPKIQNGGLYRDDVSFILFDVMINGNYQPRNSIIDIADYFNIDRVPILFEGILDDGIKYVLQERKSTIAKNGAEIEGLVARPKVELQTRTGKRVITKIKWSDLKDCIYYS